MKGVLFVCVAAALFQVSFQACVLCGKACPSSCWDELKTLVNDENKTKVLEGNIRNKLLAGACNLEWDAVGVNPSRTHRWVIEQILIRAVKRYAYELRSNSSVTTCSATDTKVINAAGAARTWRIQGQPMQTVGCLGYAMFGPGSNNVQGYYRNPDKNYKSMDGKTCMQKDEDQGTVLDGSPLAALRDNGMEEEAREQLLQDEGEATKTDELISLMELQNQGQTGAEATSWTCW